MAPRAAVRELAAPSHGTSALEGLYETYAPELRRRCLRLTRDAHAADDLMQEVLVRFLTRFPEPPPNMNVGAYLHATARNVLWKQLRDSHEVSDGEIEATVGADDDLERDPERSMLLGEQQSLVRRCAAVLSGRQRRALTMRDVEGRSYDEIGSELGIGTGAVMQVISRARARLRVAVRRANVDVDNLSPECTAMLGPLSDYLDGRAASTEAEVETHLATCDDCCQTLASFQEAGSRLRGLLPLVPLGGVISRLRGKLHGARSSTDGLGASATTHAPVLARIGNVLGRGGDSPLGVAGVGAMVTAAVIALAGGGIVIAQHVGSGSGHSLVAAASTPRASHPAVALQPAVTPVTSTSATQSARPYGGHPYSPAAAALAPAASAAPPRTPPRRWSASTPTAPAAPVATPKAPISTEPVRGGQATPLPSRFRSSRFRSSRFRSSSTPTLTVPVKVPVVSVPVVTRPRRDHAVPTVPTVPTTPVVPPVSVPAIPLAASASFAVLAGARSDEHRTQRAHR